MDCGPPGSFVILGTMGSDDNHLHLNSDANEQFLLMFYSAYLR